MLAGMFVTHQGRTAQVLTITGPGIGHSRDTAMPTRYTLQFVTPVEGEESHVTLTNPTAEELGELTPACAECGVDPGFCPGVDPHYWERMAQ